MSRNIVPRENKDADLGTPVKNWNSLYVDTIFLRNSNLQTLLNGKVNLNTLTAKGDLYTATGPGVITRLPVGVDGYVLKSDSSMPEGITWGPAGARQELTEDITVTVGSTGDFPTINSALENIVALYYPKYISGNNCPKVTIELQSGFVMNEQVLVKSLDLSWITITGIDSETIIDPTTGFSISIDTNLTRPAFAAMNGGFLPIIGQLFNVGSSIVTNGKDGVHVTNNSRAIILPGCGVKNALFHGLKVSNCSVVNAYGAIFSGAGQHGISAFNNSIINAPAANASGAGFHGIFAYRNCLINANGAIATGAANRGIYSSYSSNINAEGADALSAGQYGLYVDYGSFINANGATGTLFQTKNVITANGIIFQP